MKKVTVTILMALFSLLLMGAGDCGGGDSKSDLDLKEKQEQIMLEANAQVGMPAIKNFQERKLMKMILELRDQENLMCYAYLFSEQTGKLIYIGRCVGFGLPYATQYTSPNKKVNGTQCSIAMPQADPNGLFMPSSAEGTWLMMVNPKTGQPSPCYFEPRVVVSPFSFEEQK